MLSEGAMDVVMEATERYRNPQWYKQFGRKALEEAFSHLERENSVRTLKRRNMIREEICRRDMEEMEREKELEALQKKIFNSKRQAEDFARAWERACAPFRRAAHG